MENAQRIMLLLPLLRQKLKSVISNGNCKLRIFFVLKILIVVFLVVSSQFKKIWGKWIYAGKACCIIKTKTRSIIFNNAACFRFNSAACFNNATCRFSTCKITPDNFPAAKKDRTRFSHTVCIIFLSTFGDIMQTENNEFG